MTPDERRIKKAAKAKRYREKLKTDPDRKAVLRARHNEWRRMHRAKHGSYPTQEHLDKAAAYNRKRYHEKLKNDPNYKEKARKIRAKFHSTEHSKEYHRNWARHRRATDPNYKLYGTLCSRISAILGRREIRNGTVELLGCSISEFMVHIEKQFQEGMSWGNYGRGAGKWNLDHIRPCASFNLLDPEQQKECFNWKNLRPLWHQENNSKKSFHDGKHWFREEHPRYSPEICACPAAAEVAQ